MVDFDWQTIVVSTAIAIGLGFFFKYLVKPKIEQVYENNRNALLSLFLGRIYSMDRQMEEIFTILERQPRFVHGRFQRFNFSDTDRMLIGNSQPLIRLAENEIDKSENWRLHIRDDEYFTMLNYAHFTNLFIQDLRKVPWGEYAPELIESRVRFRGDMIKLLGSELAPKWKHLWSWEVRK